MNRSGASKNSRRPAAAVDAVAAGNEVLAGVARASAQAVEVLPTSIDTRVLRADAARRDEPPTIAWIGSPENLVYLEMIRPALARLSGAPPRAQDARDLLAFSGLAGGQSWSASSWSAATEAASLAAAHIGVMPLTDDAWSRGKCAFKLLQYMAASLPCVASPVGANTEAVIDGVNGFHATGDLDEWERSLGALDRLGRSCARDSAPAGHAHVEQRYALRATRRNICIARATRLAGCA